MALYRSEKPDYLNPWVWYGIFTHPRWQLPHLEPPSRRERDYWSNLSNNQQEAWKHSQVAPKA